MNEAFKFDPDSQITVPEKTMKALLTKALQGMMEEGVTIQNVSYQTGKQFQIVFGPAKDIVGGP